MKRPFPKAVLSAAVLALIAAGAGGLEISGQFISEKEGLELSAYRDSIGIWTICRGHTEGVKAGDVATTAQCDTFFRTDLGRQFIAVQKLVKVDIEPPTEAALTSFAFNVGIGKFKGSTLLRKLNAGDVSGACYELPRWIYAGGRNCLEEGSNCAGIPQRRADEQALCLMGAK